MSARRDMLDAALTHARRGWPVFPCSPENKQPLVKAAAKNEGGLHLATTDEKQIRKWWTRWPQAMIGVPTGARSGFIAIDLDPREHPADDMLAALKQWAVGDRALPPCAVSRTQSGGLHLLFAMPSEKDDRGKPCGNRAGLFRRVEAAGDAIRNHVDVRGEGGYIIVPPSRMASGATYEWEAEPDDELPALPERLRKLILREGGFGSGEQPAPRRRAESPARAASDAADEAVTKYATAALVNARRRIATAPAGTRNQALNNEALGLGHMIAAGALSEGLVRAELEAAAAECGLTADDGIEATRATIDSGLAAGKREPYDFSAIREKAIARAARGYASRRGATLRGSRRDGSERDGDARDGARPHEPSSDPSSRPAPPSGEEGEAMNPRGEAGDFDGAREGSDGGPGQNVGGAGAEDGYAIRQRAFELAEDSDRLWKAMSQPLNDVGNARRLLIWFGSELLFVRNVGWHRWAGTHWEIEGGDEHAARCAQMIGVLIEAEADELALTKREEEIVRAAAEPEEKLRQGAKFAELESAEQNAITNAEIIRKAWTDRKKKRRAFGVSSGNAAKISGMLNCAAPHCTVPVEKLDADALSLNVLNGTLKFARVESPDSGEVPQYELQVTLRPHDRKDLITKLAPVIYDPEAEAPTFKAFVERFLPVEPVRRFVQVFHGHALTGEHEQALIYNWGRGANGKSVFIEVMARIGGNYVQMLPVESLSGDGQRRGDQATPEFARLPGARMVRVSELEKGQKLKEALVKALTGGEPFLARHLHKGFFEVRPVFKPVLSSNHKPEIYGTDEGIWRRVNIVPWDVTIPAEERRPFEEVVREMVAEGSGILNWLIAGLAQYVRDGGLRPPAEVRAATDEHRDDMDPMARFVRHCVVVRTDIEMSDAPDWQPPEAVRVGARQMFEAFNKWLVANGAKPWGETAFGRQMGERAETFGFKRFDKRVRFYAPIELHDVPEWSPESADPGWSPP